MTLKTLHLLLTSIIVGMLLGFFGATAAHYFRVGIDFLDNTSKNYFQNTTGFFFYFCALSLCAFIINKNKNISNITNLKILPIGSKQYLALVKLDYKDSLGDVDIVETNTALKIEIVETESTITEIYFNPQ